MSESPADGRHAGGGSERVSEAASSSWLPATASARVWLITRSEYLREEVARIAAAASVPVRAAASYRELGGDGTRGGTVLVGSDIDEPPAAWGATVLIGLSGEGDSLWERAAELGAERVAVLPEAAGWLAEYLSHLDGGEASGQVVGVLGACGGAGASTLAVWLAQAASAHTSTLLVDADPWGGGLDIALGSEEVAGIRWADLASAKGSINPAQLQRSLPEVGGFSLLSFGEQPATAGGLEVPAAAHEVLSAAARGYGLTILDLGRHLDSVDMASACCQHLVLVAPARVRAAMAARGLADRIGHLPVSVVVRGPLFAGVDAQLVADAVGFPLAAYWKPMRGLPAAAEGGRLFDVGGGRAGRRLTSAVLEHLSSEVPQPE